MICGHDLGSEIGQEHCRLGSIKRGKVVLLASGLWVIFAIPRRFRVSNGFGVTCIQKGKVIAGGRYDWPHCSPWFDRCISMSQQDRYDMFCELLTRYQAHIRGYILALVRNREDADDLFQTTSLVLWRRFDTFQAGGNFFAWARRTAEFTVCNFWKTNRSRFTPLSEAFLDTLAATEPSDSRRHRRRLSCQFAPLYGQASSGGSGTLDLSLHGRS